MKRGGFSLVEVIFVIVILGIIATVAIPRLSATRDDASISAAATNIQTVFKDFSSYYVSQGSFDVVDTSNMSNVSGSGYGFFVNPAATNGYRDAFEYNTSSGQCFKIMVSDDGNVSLQAQATSDNVCIGLKELLSDKTVSIGGKKISY